MRILDAVGRNELLSIGRSCDVGLALVPMHSDDSNFQTITGESNKAFDYLACGLAMAKTLGIVAPGGTDAGGSSHIDGKGNCRTGGE